MEEKLRTLEVQLEAVKIDLEKRLRKVEADLLKVRRTVHKVANDHMNTVALIKQVDGKLAYISGFVDGTSSIFGFAKKHWITALKFGCGFMTYAAIGNPKLWQFVEQIFAR